jgi:hypothetical protein
MRIQLELPQTKVDELKVLMEQAGIQTYKELFNNALTLLVWATDEVKAGRALASVDEQKDKYRILLMPMLETLGKRVNAQPVKPEVRVAEQDAPVLTGAR